ncbi:MAG: hypothetical protein NT027_12790 [Proteobacteria bacterium]|nr:hypothetical protein [Pseudomonadota bacterium]
MRFLQVSFLLLLISEKAFSADAAKPASEFEYPELMVSPSASERLAQEAKEESGERYTQHWAIQSSAAMTLLAGIMAGSDPGKNPDSEKPQIIKSAAMAGKYVGGGWLALTGAMTFMYSPYKSGQKDLAKLPHGNKREQLAYERIAEEGLAFPANVSRTLKWTSFISNAAVGALIAGSASNDSTKIFGTLAFGGSLIPLLFETNWSRVYNNQELYKKRVYGPLTSISPTLLPQENGSYTPGWTLSMSF